jgi:hypothetical protein
VLLVVENASVTFNAIGSNGSTIVSPATTVGWDPEKYEITLLSAGGVAKDEIFQIDANVAFDMAIEGIETLSGKSAITALKGMASEVEGVLKGTETECRKLGFVR